MQAIYVAIPAIITGLFSLLLLDKRLRRRSLMKERKQEKKRLTKIIIKLFTLKGSKLQKALNEIKIWLDTDGMNGFSHRFQKDAHIWTVISEIEVCKNTKKILKIRKKQLEEYLLLFLKRNNKLENQKGIFIFRTIIAGLALGANILLYSYIIYKAFGDSPYISRSTAIKFIIFIILFMIFMACIIIYPLAQMRNEILNTHYLFFSKGGLKSCGICLAIIGVGILVYFGLFFVILNKSFVILGIQNSLDQDVVKGLMVILNLIFCLYVYDVQSEKVVDDYKYYEKIVQHRNNAWKEIVACLKEKYGNEDIAKEYKKYFSNTLSNSEDKIIQELIQEIGDQQ